MPTFCKFAVEDEDDGLNGSHVGSARKTPVLPMETRSNHSGSQQIPLTPLQFSRHSYTSSHESRKEKRDSAETRWDTRSVGLEDRHSWKEIAESFEKHSWRERVSFNFKDSKEISIEHISIPADQVTTKNSLSPIRTSTTVETMRFVKSAVQDHLRAWENYFQEQDFEYVHIAYDDIPPRFFFISARSWQASLVNNLLWLAAMWSMFFAPLSCGFGLDCTRRHLASPAFHHADQAIGILYALCGVFLRFRTSIILVQEELEIVSCARLAWMTLGKWNFWFDFVSLFPALLTDALFEKGSDARRVFPLVAMLRIWRITLKSLEGVKFDEFGWWSHFSRVGRLLAGTTLIAHFEACCWFLVVEMCGTLEMQELIDDHNLDLLNAYGRCILTGAGVLYNIYSPPAFSDGERYFQAVLFPISAFIMSVLFAELVVAVSQITFAANRRHENMAIIQGATAQLGVTKKLREKILRYEHYVTWHYDVKMYQQLISSLSQQLHRELKLQLFTNFIGSADILRGLDGIRVKQLVMAFDEFVYCPGDFVVVAGEFGDEMFFIVKGSCDVLSGEIEDENILAIKNKGDYFGEICLLFPGLRRSAHVRARCFCVIAKLESSAFDCIIPEESEERNRMMKRVESFANFSPPKTCPDTPNSSIPKEKGGTPISGRRAPLPSTAGTPLHRRLRKHPHSGESTGTALCGTQSNRSGTSGEESPTRPQSAVGTGFCLSPMKPNRKVWSNSREALETESQEEDEHWRWPTNCRQSVRSLDKRVHHLSVVMDTIQKDVSKLLVMQRNVDVDKNLDKELKNCKPAATANTGGYFDTLLSYANAGGDKISPEKSDVDVMEYEDRSVPSEQHHSLRYNVKESL